MLDILSHKRNSPRELQWKRSEKGQMKVLTPCHPTGTKRNCFSSHLHHCNSSNTTIFHVPFLTASQAIGTGIVETSKVATLFELVCWELFKTIQNKVSLCGSMEPVCQCVPACTKVCVHHLPLGLCSQHHEHRMLSPVVLVHAQGFFFFFSKRNSHWIHCFVKWKWQEM